MSFLKALRNFGRQSNVHGLNRAVNGGCEGWTWKVILTAAIILAGFMIAANMRESRENPISTTVDSRPVSEVPLPAVTVLQAKQVMRRNKVLRQLKGRGSR